MSRSVGFYQVPRALRIDENWKNLSFEYRHVFETILCHCAYKEMTLDDYGVKILLKPLQMLTTIRELVTLCNETSVDRSLVERALKKFKNIDFSRQETRHRKTVITITQSDICEMYKSLNETRIETNSRQTRDKLETEKNKENTEYTCFVMKKNSSGVEFEVSQSEIFRLACFHRKDWKTIEIQDAWKIFIDAEGYVTDPFKMIEAIILNRRKKEQTSQKKSKNTPESPEVNKIVYMDEEETKKLWSQL